MYKILFLALLNTKNIDSFLCNDAMQFTLDCHSDYLYTGKKPNWKIISENLETVGGYLKWVGFPVKACLEHVICSVLWATWLERPNIMK